MSAVYNEVDPVACAVLRHLSATGLIAPGTVIEKSIREIHDLDLLGCVQFHGFAGAGLWSVAARLAGWPDDRPLWTASVPCQPFSAAGKQRGFADDRDLWPDFFRLVRACRPVGLAGEQVASASGPWLDRARADLEAIGYEFRVVSLAACAVDAPHIRQRLFWAAVDVADADRGGHRRRPEDPQRGAQRRDAAERADGPVAQPDGGREARRGLFGPGEEPGAHGERPRDQSGRSDHDLGDPARGSGSGAGRSETHGRAPGSGEHRRPNADLGDAGGARLAQRSLTDDQRRPIRHEGSPAGAPDHRSFWMDAEWLACADGKARRAKPGVRLLVDGMVGRSDLWRLAGNSIVPQLAAEVLKALKERLDE